MIDDTLGDYDWKGVWLDTVQWVVRHLELMIPTPMHGGSEQFTHIADEDFSSL